ncbi:MAG: hypothetical protein A4S09_04320 [Proteobacteria bacterium SG_bin7]|nr:MAG: hypothetical protein A4S09_04320 [Proteobacteria bacterium SG_bin7]
MEKLKYWNNNTPSLRQKKDNSRSEITPYKSLAGAASISFNVENVDEVYSYPISKGVKFSLAPTSLPNEGIKLAIAVDSNGFEICFPSPSGQKAEVRL